MQWLLIIVLFDFLQSGKIWIDSEVVPFTTQKECNEQAEILKQELQTASTIMCLRK